MPCRVGFLVVTKNNELSNEIVANVATYKFIGVVIIKSVNALNRKYKGSLRESKSMFLWERKNITKEKEPALIAATRQKIRLGIMNLEMSIEVLTRKYPILGIFHLLINSAAKIRNEKTIAILDIVEIISPLPFI